MAIDPSGPAPLSGCPQWVESGQLVATIQLGPYADLMSKADRVYVRFVCFRLVESQRQRLGLFQALDEAKGCNFAPSWAVRQIGEIYGWFKENLTVPSQFSRGGWKGRGQPGLFWFKPVATEHIKQMHQLKLALEACGVHVEILTTRDPRTHHLAR